MTAKLHRVHLPNMGECLVPRGSGYPFEAYDVCPPGFVIGDVIRLGKKTFVLAKAGGALTTIGLGVKNGLCQGVANCAVAAAAAAGDKEVTLTLAATDGAAGTGLVLADEFAGGEIVFFSAGVDTPQRRGIVGNTARIATGSLPVTFTLDSPLTYALTTSDTGEAMQSPWSHVVHDVEIGHPVVGVPTVKATSGQYLWLQSYGPTFVSPQAAVGIAGATGLYWRHDGSVDVENADAYVSDQYAGFVLAESSTHTQGAPWFMLQILP